MPVQLPAVTPDGDLWGFSTPIYLGEIGVDGHVYAAAATASRPIEDYAVRVVPAHAGSALRQSLG